MAITNKPAATPSTHQVGNTVYIPRTHNSFKPATAVIEKTRSVVTDTDNNASAEQVNYYWFVGMPDDFKLPESEVFETAEDLEEYTDGLIDELDES